MDWLVDWLITDTADYCPTKYFNVSCPAGSVILMNSAYYGRMSSGQCVGIGYGRCSVSVLTYMHASCSARTRCSVYVSNPDLLKMNPCSRDLAVYLRANHTCVPGMTASVTPCVNPKLLVKKCITMELSVSLFTPGCNRKLCKCVNAYNGCLICICLHLTYN